jgi:hypothetical protein
MEEQSHASIADMFQHPSFRFMSKPTSLRWLTSPDFSGTQWPSKLETRIALVQVLGILLRIESAQPKETFFLKKNSRLNRFKITKKKTLRPQQGHCKTARLGWATFMFREDTGHPTHASVFFLVLAPVSETNRASSMVSLGCARSFFVANGCARSMTEDRE